MKTLTVLLLDDSASERQLVMDMLRAVPDYRFQVDVATVFDEALELVAKRSYDAFLVDYQLNDAQGRTGLDFIQYIMAEHPDIPTILITSFGSRELDLAAMEMGAVDYIERSRLHPSLLERVLRYATERARSYRQLHQLYRQVSDLEHLKTEVIRLAGHNIGNQLLAILTTVSLLKYNLMGQLDETNQTHLERIETLTTSIHKLTRDILSLERISLLQKNPNQIVELDMVVAEVVVGLIGEAENKQQRLNLETVSQTLPVLCDGLQLHETLMNLVSNAIKYTPLEGEIVVKLRSEAGRAIVEVQDNGYGVPPELQSRLFQPFYRAISPANQHIEGTGMGLYLVKTFIEKYEGEVFFESTYGKGSTFGFWLPLA